MVYIREVVISPEQEEHIWVKHRVTPEEVEEVCFSRPLVVRSRDRTHAVYGQTEVGRYLVIFLHPKGRGTYSLATAREMKEAEKRRYQQFLMR